MRDLSRWCCQNSSCPDYGRRGLGNLRLAGWSGQGKRIRMLQCKRCLRPFSERKGTLLFGSHLPEMEAVSILEYLAEGCGIRQSGRLTGHTKDTVNRLAKMAGQHGQTRMRSCGSMAEKCPSHGGFAGGVPILFGTVVASVCPAR